MSTAYFNSFSIELPDRAVADCSHQGPCDKDVAYWAPRIKITPYTGYNKNPKWAISAELKETGAWEEDKLFDDEENKRRIIWIVAGNIKENQREERH